MEGRYWERHPDGPFATLISVAAGYLHPEWACPAWLRWRARHAEDDPEMQVFKAELRQAMMHPERLPGSELSREVQHDYGSAVAFLEQLWRYLYGSEPPAEPGTPEASRKARPARNLHSLSAFARHQPGRADQAYLPLTDSPHREFSRSSRFEYCSKFVIRGEELGLGGSTVGATLQATGEVRAAAEHRSSVVAKF
jgi:hypothetical protein